MEHVNCDLCGIDNTNLLFKVNDLRYQGQQLFNLVRCKRCNLVYVNPRPQAHELKKYYDRYYTYETLNHDSKKEKYSFLKHCDVGRLKRYKGRGRILDIGCGKGDFLAKINNTGWEVVGTELHPEAARYAREKNKIEVHEEDLGDLNFPLKSFDVIRLHHVIEHLSSPHKTLKRIHNILKEDGLLIIACPNFTKFTEIVFADKWDALDVPRHLYQFNPGTLKRLLLKTGFKTVSVYHNQMFQNLVVMKNSLFNKFSSKNYQTGKKSTPAVGDPKSEKKYISALKIIFNFSIVILIIVLGWCQTGGTIELYCRKR